MANSDDSSDAGNQPEMEGASEAALLEVYSSLREEILQNGDRKDRRNVRGIAAMIVLIGYAVNFEEPVVAAVVPVVFSYLLIRTSKSMVSTYNLAYQVSEIERELSPFGSSVRYEIERGGLAGSDLNGHLKQLRDSPRKAEVLFSIVVYLSLTLTIYALWGNFESKEILSVTISQQQVGTSYAILAILTIYAWYRTYKYREMLNNRIKNNVELQQAKQSDADEQNDEA